MKLVEISVSIKKLKRAGEMILICKTEAKGKRRYWIQEERVKLDQELLKKKKKDYLIDSISIW